MITKIQARTTKFAPNVDLYDLWFGTEYGVDWLWPSKQQFAFLDGNSLLIWDTTTKFAPNIYRSNL